MKKTAILSILCTLLIFPIIKHTTASSYGIPLKEYQFTSFPFQKEQIPNYQYLKNIVIFPESHFNEEEALNIVLNLSQISDSILKRLIISNVQVKLFTGKLTDQPSVMYLKGLKPRGYTVNGPTWDDIPGIGGTKLVLVRIGYSDKGMGHGSINLELHEIAHSIDKYVFDIIHDDPQFREIWHHDAQILFPNIAYFNFYPEEYFAEVFAMYFLNSEYRTILKNRVPLTYEFLQKLANEGGLNSNSLKGGILKGIIK